MQIKYLLAGLIALSLTACVDVDANSESGKAKIFEPPHTVISAPKLKVIFVRGNYYNLVPKVDSKELTVTAPLKAQYNNVDAPNAEDAAVAVETLFLKEMKLKCKQGELRFKQKDYAVRKAEEKQIWTFFSEGCV